MNEYYDKLRQNIALLAILKESGIDYATREFESLRTRDYTQYLEVYSNLGLYRYLNGEFGGVVYRAGFFLNPEIEERIAKINLENLGLYAAYYNAQLLTSYQPYELLDYSPSLQDQWNKVTNRLTKGIVKRELSAIDTQFDTILSNFNRPEIVSNSRYLIPGKCCVDKDGKNFVTVYFPFIFVPLYTACDTTITGDVSMTGFGKVLDHNSDKEVATGNFCFELKYSCTNQNIVQEWCFEFENIEE
jgi:hypothetical protein